MCRFIINVLLLLLLFAHSAFSDESLDSLKEKAKHGNADAQYNLGNMYLTGQDVPRDFAEAKKWYLKAAGQGHADAQYSLGNMYYKGKGSSINIEEAMTWYRKAAEQGHATAQLYLGNIYYEGRVVKQDYAEAIKWYCQSAKQGYPIAQFRLALMYSEGNSVRQDYVTAYAWFNISEKSGLNEAMGARSDLVESMTQQQISEGESLTRELMKNIKPGVKDFECAMLGTAG